jgi:hypothetical protein
MEHININMQTHTGDIVIKCLAGTTINTLYYLCYLVYCLLLSTLYTFSKNYASLNLFSQKFKLGAKQTSQSG